MTCEGIPTDTKKCLAIQKLTEAGRDITVRELVKEVSTSGPLIQLFMDAGLGMTLAEYVSVIYDSESESE